MGTQTDILKRVDRQNFENLEIQIADGSHLEKSKNCHISVADKPIPTKIGTAMQFNPLEPSNH